MFHGPESERVFAPGFFQQGQAVAVEITRTATGWENCCMQRLVLSICPHCNVRCARDESGHCPSCHIHHQQPVIYPRCLNVPRVPSPVVNAAAGVRCFDQVRPDWHPGRS
jgi:hypothetical protein